MALHGCFTAPRIATLSPLAQRISAPQLLQVRCCSGGEQEQEQDEEQRKIKLQQLDNQLQGLSSANSVPKRTSSIPPPQIKSDEDLEVKQFPEVESSFFVKFAAILVLLTVVNNLLFIYFFHPKPPKRDRIPLD